MPPGGSRGKGSGGKGSAAGPGGDRCPRKGPGARPGASPGAQGMGRLPPLLRRSRDEKQRSPLPRWAVHSNPSESTSKGHGIRLGRGWVGVSEPGQAPGSREHPRDGPRCGWWDANIFGKAGEQSRAPGCSLVGAGSPPGQGYLEMLLCGPAQGLCGQLRACVPQHLLPGLLPQPPRQQPSSAPSSQRGETWKLLVANVTLCSFHWCLARVGVSHSYQGLPVSQLFRLLCYHWAFPSSGHRWFSYLTSNSHLSSAPVLLGALFPA